MSTRSCLPAVFLVIVLLGWSAGVWAADSGLVAWWKFDEGAGTVTADSSRNGHTGTLVGAEWYTPGWDETGHCLEFLYADDESDLVDLGTMDVFGAGMTITAWMNPHTFSQHDARVISKSNTAATADGHWWMLGTNNEVNARFRLKTDESDTTLTLIDSAGVIVAGEWQFITARWDGTTAYTYVNAVETGSAAKGGTAVATDSSVPAAIGNQPANDPDGHRAWDGLIDDVRIYNRALTMDELAEVMLGGGPGSATELASAPVPGDGQDDVPRDTSLSWSAGIFAGTHNVYLGTAQADVEAATTADGLGVLVSEGQAGTSYEPPAVLEFGQTYYWRIDEVNATPDNTVFKGDLWSFTVEPVAYPIESVVATSNAIPQSGADPANMVNGAGLNEQDEHSIGAGDMWLGAPAGEDAPTIEFAFDQAYKLHEMLVWNYNVQFELMLGFGIKDVTVEYSENGADWTVLGDVTLAQGTARADYVSNTTIDFGGVVAQYVRLTVNSGWGVMGQYGLSEVRFLYLPVLAREPEPGDGTVDVSPEAVLSWRAGREAVSHEVYFGTDEQAGLLVDTVGGSSYAPDDLELDTTYYWKVAEVNEAAVPGTWDGPVWSFSTQEYLVVDDFESYDDDENAIYDAWLDGWINETGSTVGYLDAPFAERTIVHEGSQSMPLFYDNGAAGISEAELTLAPAQDWTQAGIATLVVHFRGDADNTGGQLYAKINGVKVTYDGAADALTKLLWQQWNIDLASVGTNLTNVTTLLIGIEGGGEGVVYVDDIRLYRVAPGVAGSEDPGMEGLLLEYAFDSDASDSSGNGYDGTPAGDARVQDGVLFLDGIRDVVAVPRIGGDGATFSTCSYSMWVYPTDDLTSLQFSGGMNTDGWVAGAVHFKFHYGLLNVGINGLDGGDLEGATAVVPNAWNHMALSISETEIAIYLNGQREDSRTLAAPLADLVLGGASLGGWSNGGTIEREMPGQMDNVLVYDRGLSEAEVRFLAGL